jgi:cytochrome b6-f complex iron-sulfur subunit
MTRNDTPPTLPGDVSRRTVLAVGATGAAAVTLAACSKAASPSAVNGGAATTAATTGAAASSAGGASSAAGSSAAGSGGKVLATLADVPAGSAVAATGTDGGPIIISRTGAASVVAFSAICPHQGCTVAPSFACPCHGSTFDAKTGTNLSGPAPSGLTAVPVSVSGQNIVAG